MISLWTMVIRGFLVANRSVAGGTRVKSGGCASSLSGYTFMHKSSFMLLVCGPDRLVHKLQNLILRGKVNQAFLDTGVWCCGFVSLFS
jgi:hypothetical protein